MNYRITLVLSLMMLSAGVFASSPCQEKQQDIQQEIRYAEKHHNQRRIDGLNKALLEIKSNCSNNKQRAAHKDELAKQRQKVIERKRELQDALQSGDADNIDKRKHQLNEARHQLKELESHHY